MGGDYYVRANGDALFEVPKPIRQKGIGVDALPDAIKNSSILTGNDLGMLGNVEELPPFSSDVFTDNWDERQRNAQKLLLDSKIEAAWIALVG